MTVQVAFTCRHGGHVARKLFLFEWRGEQQSLREAFEASAHTDEERSRAWLDYLHNCLELLPVRYSKTRKRSDGGSAVVHLSGSPGAGKYWIAASGYVPSAALVRTTTRDYSGNAVAWEVNCPKCSKLHTLTIHQAFAQIVEAQQHQRVTIEL